MTKTVDCHFVQNIYMGDNPVDVYAHKYGLTTGIIHFKGTPTATGNVSLKQVGTFVNYFSKDEYSLTLEAAYAKLSKKRDKKLASLRKKIVELSDLHIPEGEPNVSI